jgi:ribonuclease BN (tRNA processing enzyme)
LLTHFHPDHSGELASFLFATRYPDPARRVKPITLYGGPGLTDFFNRLQAVYGHWIELPENLFRVVEIDPDRNNRYSLNSHRLTAVAVNHNPESLAYRIDFYVGVSVVFSGDTDWSDNLVELARGADLFVCESATPDGQKIAGHLTPQLAGRKADLAGVQKLVLTHFYPACEAADLVSQCRAAYAGPLLLAHDLMTIAVGKSQNSGR